MEYINPVTGEPIGHNWRNPDSLLFNSDGPIISPPPRGYTRRQFVLLLAKLGISLASLMLLPACMPELFRNPRETINEKINRIKRFAEQEGFNRPTRLKHGSGLEFDPFYNAVILNGDNISVRDFEGNVSLRTGSYKGFNPKFATYGHRITRMYRKKGVVLADMSFEITKIEQEPILGMVYDSLNDGDCPLNYDARPETTRLVEIQNRQCLTTKNGDVYLPFSVEEAKHFGGQYPLGSSIEESKQLEELSKHIYLKIEGMEQADHFEYDAYDQSKRNCDPRVVSVWCFPPDNQGFVETEEGRKILSIDVI